MGSRVSDISEDFCDQLISSRWGNWYSWRCTINYLCSVCVGRWHKGGFLFCKPIDGRAMSFEVFN
jgi:hypothetical protein